MKSSGLKGVNKPKRTNFTQNKSLMLLWPKEGGTTKYKVVRFGQKEETVAGKPKAGESSKNES